MRDPKVGPRGGIAVCNRPRLKDAGCGGADDHKRNQKNPGGGALFFPDFSFGVRISKSSRDGTGRELRTGRLRAPASCKP